MIDNIDRAIEAAETASDPASLLQGFKMVHQQLLDALRQHGVEPMSVLGAPFDPELHEAIAQGPSDEHEAGTVSQVGRKGYRLHERVIRPAQVVVSTGKQQEDPT